MEILDKWERKLGWMKFPGLLRYYALFHVLVFLLQFMNPHIGEVLDFNKSRIFAGEIWRVVTFVFVSESVGQPGAFAMLFLFFMVMIAFMMSDALEGAWGVFRTTLFYYAGYLGLLLANFIFPAPLPGSGFFIYMSAFFAFATLFPKHEFLMFFILPVQVRWLGILLGGLHGAGCAGDSALHRISDSRIRKLPAMGGRSRDARTSSRRGSFGTPQKIREEESFR